jgi:phenylacetate-coenzyme A ligase PaaK-like adenylate-forming protein
VTATAGQATDPRVLAGQYLARTAWSPQRLAAHQQGALAALLRHAVAASPYYRRVLGPDPARVPFGQLPTLSKATLLEQFDEIVTDRRLTRAVLDAHLAGPHATQPLHGHLVLSTSGSTGVPAVFVYSPAEMASAVAGLVRAMTLLGVTPSTRLLGIGSPSAVHISRHLVAGLVAGRSSGAAGLSATTPIPQLVEAFNAYQPDAFPANAGVAALLAEEQLAGRLRIAPRIVACTSEVLSADMRARIRAAWQVEPHQLYATTEAGVLASTGPQHSGLHLWEDLALVEVVDAAGRPVRPGTIGQKVLVTNLVNRIQPLIRYEISDLVTLTGDPDPAGWPFRRIAAVGGRTDDVLQLPAAGGGTVAVHPFHLRAPFAAFVDVVQYQIVQHDRSLSVSVLLRPAAPADTTARISAALTAGLAGAGAVPPPINVTPVARIEHDGEHSGKFTVVRSLRPAAGR